MQKWAENKNRSHISLILQLDEPIMHMHWKTENLQDILGVILQKKKIAAKKHFYRVANLLRPILVKTSSDGALASLQK